MTSSNPSVPSCSQGFEGSTLDSSSVSSNFPWTDFSMAAGNTLSAQPEGTAPGSPSEATSDVPDSPLGGN